MKQIYIENLEQGNLLNEEQFVVKNVYQGKTVQGKNYIDLILSDRTGEVAGKIWELNIDNCAEVKVGDIVAVSGKIESFREKPQINITFLQKADDFKLDDFLPKTEKDIDELWEIVSKQMKTIKNKHLKELLSSLFSDKKFVEQYKNSPAAEKIHHAYLGGLLEHVVEMLNLNETITADYPNLDKDLMIAGIILHDIGKLDELNVNHTIFRTTEGNLLSHITLGALRIDKAIAEINDFPMKLRNLLLHLLISHHGKLEFGSPVKPMTREAIALTYIDNLSAKINTVENVIAEADDKAGDFSSPSYALETKIYLG